MRVPESARSANAQLGLTIGGKQANTITIAVSAQGELLFTHGVASGEATATSAILWTRAVRDAQIIAEISEDPNFDSDNPAVIRRDVIATSEHDFTVKVEVEGLQPASTYFYRFKIDDNISETGTFKTPPLSSTSSGVRFTWSSDTDGSLVPPLNNFEVLDRAREENADFFVYLGDTVYMDTNPPLAQDLPSMRAKYRQVRDFRALRDLLASSSTYAIWDDHEVVNDFAGQTVDPALFAAGRQAFQEYMPISDWSDSLGFFRTFRWGKDVELFILDERSFRSEGVEAVCKGDLAPTLSQSLRTVAGLPPTPPPGCLDGLSDPTRTLLGPVQK